MIMTLTACGKDTLTGDNSVEVTMFEHTFRIRELFSEQNSGSEYNRTYADRKGQEVVAYAATANHAGIEANMDHMLPMLAESCRISRQKMETEPAELEGHEESVLFAWNYQEKGLDVAACGIAVKDEDSMLYLVETSDHEKPDELKEDVLAMAKTVKYTGTYGMTKKEAYPYRVENGDVAVTVPEGYECMQLADAKADTSDGKDAVNAAPGAEEGGNGTASAEEYSGGTVSAEDDSSEAIGVEEGGSGTSGSDNTESIRSIHTDSDLLAVRYTNARTYEAGGSFFQVKKLDPAGQTLQEKAEETASKLKENAEAAKPEERKVRDIWPDAANVADVSVWCVSSVKNQLLFEHYFLEVGGVCYYVQICSPENDGRSAEDMRKLFYGVELMVSGSESK